MESMDEARMAGFVLSHLNQEENQEERGGGGAPKWWLGSLLGYWAQTLVEGLG